MATTRVPGIYFETVAPPAPALLPRMDIAAFAGFLPSGPIGLPIAVEDPDRFQEIFGSDLSLAWDDQAKQMLMAQTPPAVRTFFSNGGRRCWVLRLAKQAQANAWIIPGLLQVDRFGTMEAGFLQARSEGSWSDDLTVNASLLENPLPAGSLVTSGPAPQIISGFYPGDMVQLYYASTATWAYRSYSDPRWFWFQSATAADLGSYSNSPPAVQPDSVTLLGPGVSLPIAFTSFSGEGNKMVLALARENALTIAPGAWLRIKFGGRILLLQAESLEAAGTVNPGSPPANDQATITSTLGWWVLNAASAWNANRSNTAQVSTVEFELWAIPPNAPTLRIADLGVAPDHPRFWGLLPSDSTLFAPVLRPAPLPYSALSADIDHPRFPLASNAKAVLGLPLGMTGLPRTDFAQGASKPGPTALDRDGLSSFSLNLFVDPQLGDSTSATLLQDANYLQYQAETPTQPSGLYALLAIDEPSLLAVPDATLNNWYRVPMQTQILAAPDPLTVSLPDDGGNYTVSWTAVPGAAGYLLQESSDLSFSTGVTQRDLGSVLFLSVQDEPQCPQQIYYRASAYGAAGSSPWSTTGSVELGTGDFLPCSQTPLLAPQMMFFDESGRILLEWVPAPGGFDGFTLQISADPRFTSASTLYQGNETGFQYWKVPGPPSYFRVNAQRAGESSAWSNTVNTPSTPVSPWVVDPSSIAPLMVKIHSAMLRIAAARADMVAILSLPASYRTSDAVAYPAQLTRSIQQREAIGRILSYAALYHPWLVIRNSTAAPPLSLCTVAPDGAVCGVIANVTLNSGAWIAPANIALPNVVALSPGLPNAFAAFDASQINLIAQQPGGFFILGQNTLVTSETDLEPLNVRRLLILIRRLALREGVRYVFQNISPSLQRQVSRQFEGWMQQMLGRGAFAGLSAATSYRVITDQSINTQDSIDQGRFLVQLQVAPSVPMRFLTIQLMQSGGQLTLSEQ